jgi:hypothetical protein
LGAKKVPAGANVPATKVDVKETKASSAAEVVTSNNEVVEAKADSDVGIDEADLSAFEDAKKIPYDRFKEVNEKAKALQRELEETKSRYDSDLRKEVENAELRAMARARASTKEEDVYVSDDSTDSGQVAQLVGKLKALESKLEQLDGKTSENVLRSQIKELERIYPDADIKAVLGWKKVTPKADLEELMQISHQETNEKFEKKMRALIDNKKEKSKKALPNSGLISLKEGEKPKSLRDAHKLVKSLGDKLFQ